MTEPIICENDLEIFKNLLSSPEYPDKELLGYGLSQAKVVKDHELGKETIRLNSEVEVVDKGSGLRTRLQIVMPDEANVKNRRISIFAPISVALLGFRQGQEIKRSLPKGETVFRIEKVRNSGETSLSTQRHIEK